MTSPRSAKAISSFSQTPLDDYIPEEVVSLQKCINGMFADVYNILVDNSDNPSTTPSIATSLELQMAQQLKQQELQIEEMRMMMEGMKTIIAKIDPILEAENKRKAEEERKAEEVRKAEAARKAEEKRKADIVYKAEAMRKGCAYLHKHGIELVIPHTNMDKSLMILIEQQRATVDKFSIGLAQYTPSQHAFLSDLYYKIKDEQKQIQEKQTQLATYHEEKRKQREEKRKEERKQREKEQKQYEEECKQRELAEHSMHALRLRISNGVEQLVPCRSCCGGLPTSKQFG